jgi:hypothetical protein
MMQSNSYPRAKQVLKSPIGGVDPVTGCDLPKDSARCGRRRITSRQMNKRGSGG